MIDWADSLQENAENNAKEYIDNLKAFDIAILSIASASIPSILLFFSKIDILSVKQIFILKIIALLSGFIILLYLLMRMAEGIISFKRARLYNKISNQIKSSDPKNLESLRNPSIIEIESMKITTDKFRKWVEIRARGIILALFTTNIVLFIIIIYEFNKTDLKQHQDTNNFKTIIEVKIINDTKNSNEKTEVKHTNKIKCIKIISEAEQREKCEKLLDTNYTEY